MDRTKLLIDWIVADSDEPEKDIQDLARLLDREIAEYTLSKYTYRISLFSLYLNSQHAKGGNVIPFEKINFKS